MTGPSQTDPPDPHQGEAEALIRDMEPYMRAAPGTLPVPPELAARVERFAAASGVDPDNVPVTHVHNNLVTGQSVIGLWPCPQCEALGRTEPMRYGEDVPDSGSQSLTEIPPDRLEAYLATFPPEPTRPPRARATPALPGDRAAERRKARRKAERKARRRDH